MLCERARVLADVDLDAVDAAVAQVGKREIDNAISAEEGERTDRTVFFKTLDVEMRAG